MSEESHPLSGDLSLRERTLEVLRAVDDPVYFAESKYFLGIKLFPKQAEILRRVYKENIRELILVAGRRSGKTVLAAVFALYEAFKLLIKPDPAAYYGLIPGRPIFIVVVAVSEEQAHDTIYATILALLQRSPFFKSQHPKIYQNEIRFPSKNVIILCGHSSSSSLVGRDVKCCVFDELARFEQTTSKRGAWNVYNSLKQSTAIFKDEGKVICISSPMNETDIIMTLYEQAQSTPGMLGLRYATWEFNPHIKFEDLAAEMQRDPIAFWRDFGAQPMESIAPYIPEDILHFDAGIPNYLRMIHDGLTVQPEPGIYALAGDPALKHDSFGFALTRRDGDKFIVCGSLRFSPKKLGQRIVTISPIEVKEFVMRVIDQIPVSVVVFDTWNYPELQQEISRKVRVVNHIVRKDDYDYFKELCYRNKVVMCPDPVAKQEFVRLQVINSRRVDHPKGGSKDVADAIVNSIWALRSHKSKIPLGVVEVV